MIASFMSSNERVAQTFSVIPPVHEYCQERGLESNLMEVLRTAFTIGEPMSVLQFYFPHQACHLHMVKMTES